MVCFSKLAALVGGVSATLVPVHEHIAQEHSIAAFLQNKVSQQQLEEAHMEKLTVEQALAANSHVPEDIKLLAHSKKEHKKINFSEEVLTKARRTMNKMITDSFTELDALVIECTQNMHNNKQLSNQLSDELRRLGLAMNAGLKQMSGAKTAGENAQELQQEEKERWQKIEAAYLKGKEEDEAELAIKNADLAVHEVILNLSQCEGGGSNPSLVQQSGHVGIKSCSSDVHGLKTFEFENPELQRSLTKLKLDSQRSLEAALGVVFGRSSHVSLLQENPQAATHRSCQLTRTNCGLLSDDMSILWGKARDAVDAQTAMMEEKTAAYDAELRDHKSAAAGLAGAITAAATSMSAGMQERDAVQIIVDSKQSELRENKRLFKEIKESCDAQISEILFDKVCGLKKIRAAIQKKSKEYSNDDLMDCTVSNWEKGDCSRSIEEELCKNEEKKMGVMILEREILQAADTAGKDGESLGVVCPPIQASIKCNVDLECPVACESTAYSAFSSCSAECGGGIKSKSRTMIRRNEYGGENCDDMQVEVPCNTGSCDRDCSLASWTHWGPCSMACSPDGGQTTGIKEKFRAVKQPLRENGHCPKKTSRLRWRRKVCNDVDCLGDEKCAAEMDLIIAVDGSGSLSAHEGQGGDEAGWKIVQNFTEEFLTKMWATEDGTMERDGNGKMRIGLLQFGNGALENVVGKDGSGNTTVISPAVRVLDLKGNLNTVKKAAKEDLKYRKGFTNMAQVFPLANNMFMLHGHTGKVKQVLLITDAAPSMQFQTTQAAEKFKDAGGLLSIVAIKPCEGELDDDLKYMRSLASLPKSTNFKHIQGLDYLQQNVKSEAVSTMIQNCPSAVSAKRIAKEANQQGFVRLAEGRDCPCWWRQLINPATGTNEHKSGTSCKHAINQFPPSEKPVYNFVWLNIPGVKHAWLKNMLNVWYSNGSPCYGNSTPHIGECNCSGKPKGSPPNNKGGDWINSIFDAWTLLSSGHKITEDEVMNMGADVAKDNVNFMEQARAQHMRVGTEEEIMEATMFHAGASERAEFQRALVLAKKGEI